MYQRQKQIWSQKLDYMSALSTTVHSFESSFKYHCNCSSIACSFISSFTQVGKFSMACCTVQRTCIFRGSSQICPQVSCDPAALRKTIELSWQAHFCCLELVPALLPRAESVWPRHDPGGSIGWRGSPACKAPIAYSRQWCRGHWWSQQGFDWRCTDRVLRASGGRGCSKIPQRRGVSRAAQVSGWTLSLWEYHVRWIVPWSLVCKNEDQSCAP